MSVLLSRYSGRALMVPFSAYFDASGTCDSQVLTVAGFVSTVNKWMRFEKEWTSILRREGIKVFHMTDFVSSKREFAEGWKGATERRRVFISDLATCIRRNVNKSFRSTLVVRDYKKVNAVFNFGNSPGLPYAFCSLMCAYTLRRWAERKKAEKRLLYYFEDGDKGKGDFERLHQRIYHTSPIFLTKEQSVPLQAADFAAWKLKTAVQEAIKPDHSFEKGVNLLRSIEVLKAIPKDGGVISEPVLLKLSERFQFQRR